MTNAYMLSQAIYVAAKFKIADHLAAGPKSAGELAKATETNPGALHRIIRTLSGEGVFNECEDGKFEINALSQWLRSSTPDSLHGWAVFRGEPVVWNAWGDILHSVKTGEPAFDHVFGKQIFQHLEGNPKDAAVFDDAMRSISTDKYKSVAEAYDFSEIKTLVDVAGGNGGMLTAILKANPKLKGINADLPHVLEGAQQHLEKDGVSNRVQCVTIDMFEKVPEGGDIYLMANIIHDWPDERAVKLLGNCREALKKDGKVLLVELALSPPNEPHLSKLADLEMLVMTPGGIERSEAEYGALFQSAGLKLTQVIPTSSPWSIIEGVAA